MIVPAPPGSGPDVLGRRLGANLSEAWGPRRSSSRTSSARADDHLRAQRNPAAPDLPTLSEAGVPGCEVTSWHGRYVPAGTPQPLVARLNADIARVLAMPGVRTWIESQAGVAGGGSPEPLAAFQAAGTSTWANLIRAPDIKPQ